MLTRLNVTHRGVPVGWLYVVEEDPRQDIAELLPPDIQLQLDRTPSLSSGEFTQFPAFAATTSSLLQLIKDIESVQADWRRALAGPPSPESREASNLAWDRILELERIFEERRAAVEQELEVRDESGVMIPASVRLWSVNPPRVAVDFDNTPAAVLARLRQLRPSGDGQIEPPAV